MVLHLMEQQHRIRCVTGQPRGKTAIQKETGISPNTPSSALPSFTNKVLKEDGFHHISCCMNQPEEDTQHCIGCTTAFFPWFQSLEKI